MEYSLSIYFLYFIIISICGWMMEVTLQLIQKHKFADRGFLIGPYCPIYGVGGLLITWGLTGLEEHPVALFCVAIVLCGVLEYLTSYVMEKIFHARWWDYSDSKYNINGRVCLETIIPFGILGLLLIYFINPFIFDNLLRIPEDTINIIAIVIGVVFAVDLILSIKVISNVRSATTKFDKENPKDNTEEISKKVKEFLRSKSFLNRRLIDAFPKLTATLKEHSERIKQKTAEMKEEITNMANDIKDDWNEKTQEVRQEINQRADMVKKNVKESFEQTSQTVKNGVKKVKQKTNQTKLKKETGNTASGHLKKDTKH